MLELLLEFLWSKTLSAPSFGRFWNQPIGRPYMKSTTQPRNGFTALASKWKIMNEKNARYFIRDSSRRGDETILIDNLHLGRLSSATAREFSEQIFHNFVLRPASQASKLYFYQWSKKAKSRPRLGKYQNHLPFQVIKYCMTDDRYVVK